MAELVLHNVLLFDHGNGNGRRGRRRQQEERIYNVRRDAWEMSDHKFRKQFRLPILLARELCEELDPFMGPPKRASSLPNAIKVGLLFT